MHINGWAKDLFHILGGISMSKPVFESFGICPICEKHVAFRAFDNWLRDALLCSECNSLPRERALISAINKFFPEWRDSIIHESSPADRGTSLKLKNEVGRGQYIGSQFYPHMPLGWCEMGRNENLSAMTFENESVNLHVTQDVIEHVFDIDAAFSEIARTLKPGGMHIFTCPIVQGVKPTIQRAKLEGGFIVNIQQPIYHGNPISEEGSIVVWDWGYDIVRRIYEASKMHTIVLQIDDVNQGIRAEYIDVLISIKTHES